jgi:hypothetical protein
MVFVGALAGGVVGNNLSDEWDGENGQTLRTINNRADHEREIECWTVALACELAEGRRSELAGCVRDPVSTLALQMAVQQQ